MSAAAIAQTRNGRSVQIAFRPFVDRRASDFALTARAGNAGRKGIFAQMIMGLAADHGEEKTVMLDATVGLIGRTKAGMNTKLHAVCDR